MEDFEFYMPTRILYGKGCIAKNKSLLSKYGKRAFIITYQIPGRHYALEDIISVLMKNALSTQYVQT